MRKHIEDEPAALCLFVIPTRALRRIQLAIEYPTAEVEPHRQHAAEKTAVIEFLDLAEPGQKQFVLHDAILDARPMRSVRQIECFSQASGDRLFEIDVLVGADRRLGPL